MLPYVTRLIDAYGCLGVLSINGGNAAESNLFLVMITGASNVGKVLDVEVSDFSGEQPLPGHDHWGVQRGKSWMSRQEI